MIMKEKCFTLRVDDIRNNNNSGFFYNNSVLNNNIYMTNYFSTSTKIISSKGISPVMSFLTINKSSLLF